MSSDKDQQADYYTRFLEEVQVTAQLDHPSIVPIMDLGFDEDRVPFYTMRYVKGRHLRNVIDLARKGEEDWSLVRLIEVLVKVCHALAHAHAKGVLHRDLKPANIMVGDLGEVYIMDWGLARMRGREDIRDLRQQLGDEEGMETIAAVREVNLENPTGTPLMTVDGTIVGTPAYTPPEQAIGKVDEVDHLSDVYALGAILYRMLSGHPPYRPSDQSVSTAKEILTQLQSHPPERIRRLDTKLAPELLAICEKAMARERAARSPSALELTADLQAYLEGRVVQAHQTRVLVEVNKWVMRNKALVLASGVVALSLLGFTALQSLSNQRLDKANTQLGVCRTWQKSFRLLVLR